LCALVDNGFITIYNLRESLLYSYLHSNIIAMFYMDLLTTHVCCVWKVIK